jgi:Tfp pilus assembly protein PilF
MRSNLRLRACALALIGVLAAGCSADPSPLAELPAAETRDLAVLTPGYPDPEREIAPEALQRAVTSLRAVLRAEPSNDDAQVNLGEVYLRLNQPSEAMSQFTAALTSSAHAAVAKQGVGLAFLKLGDANSARKYLSEAVALDPTLWRAQLGLGQIADHARDWTAAEAAYQAALALKPRAAAHNNLGLSYARQRRYDEAIAQFQASLALKQDATVRTNLRFAHAMKGDYLSALAGVAKENLPDALNNVGYAAMLRGDYDAAEAYLTRAIEASAAHHRIAADNLQLLKDLRSMKLAKATP